ncbi:hypothetical protein AVEN_4172-1 [Araneus ventricosus]|uniref:Uncharacterized protein n=1 Tax=Araneus ventricosus TaxID=182803 RepID=A0A4Y2FLA6_ARAVE|nr:hypothetical protein AVEN_4172-1 [Araneus ventricosus]
MKRPTSQGQGEAEGGRRYARCVTGVCLLSAAPFARVFHGTLGRKDTELVDIVYSVARGVEDAFVCMERCVRTTSANGLIREKI